MIKIMEARERREDRKNLGKFVDLDKAMELERCQIVAQVQDEP